jgi:hypothetical protein
LTTRPAWTAAALHPVVLAAVTATALAWLAAGLPAGAFLSGDSGVKLIAAFEAIDHPARPFETGLPRIGTRRTTFVDPMVVVHGDHGHVLQSPLFPPISAPFIAAFGLRGAYILPALSFIALVALLEAIRRHVVPDASRALLAWLVIAANPAFLYALEFWEHAPAVALLAAGTAAVVVASTRAQASGLAVIGGALVGLGVVLRPEAAWYAGGLAITFARPVLVRFGAGAAVVLLPFAAANVVHFGNPMGAHASAVLAPLGDGFAAARWARVRDWLWPASAGEWAALMLVAAAAFSGRFVSDVRVRQLAALAGVAVISALAATRALPGISFWQGFPVALMVLVPTAAGWRRSGRLYALAGVAVGGVMLTATNDGGAQWGVRYLLVAVPALLLLAARNATDAIANGPWRSMRVATVAVILILGAATSREAYLELRGAKRNYDGLVAAARSFTRPGDIVVTNLWWLDQVAATLHGSRTFLYVPDPAAASRALAAARDGRIDHLTLAWSSDAESPFPLDAALDGTCFRIAASRDVALRAVHLARVECLAD